VVADLERRQGKDSESQKIHHLLGETEHVKVTKGVKTSTKKQKGKGGDRGLKFRSPVKRK